MPILRYNQTQGKQAMDKTPEAQQYTQMQIKSHYSIKILFINLKINPNIF